MSTYLYTGQCIVVFGTASIQRYIFQSNRLKENIGASYLAKYWLGKGLIAAIEGTHKSLDTNAWDAYEENPLLSIDEAPEGPIQDVNIIYIGGGNAALLCGSRKIATEVVAAWSRELLKKAPGLRVVVGYGEVSDSLEQAYRTALDDLARCEEGLPFGSALYGLPVVRTCNTTGLPASVLSKEENTADEWISQNAASKREQVGSKEMPGDAQNVIRKEFESFLKDEQRFAIELEELGGSEGQSYIAVVHADGNGIGELLTRVVNSASNDNTKFLHYMRAFSASVSRLSQSVLEETLQYFQDLLPSLKGLHHSKDVFPLRPIVYGGDDLTFVCDGRVGLHLAAYYLQKFAEKTIRFCDTDKPVDACAGVAIVPTKFPFASAYGFSEDLCGEAKRSRREANKERDEKVGTWLDFQIVQEGVTSSLTTLREAQYRSFEGQTLHQRPYELPQNWDAFVSILKGFQSSTWPRSRAKGLLHALTQGPAATKRFIDAAEWRGINLPDSFVQQEVPDGWTGDDPPKRTTPYFDPLEALDFYLEDLPLIEMQEKDTK